jgi:hypothetical protein
MTIAKAQATVALNVPSPVYNGKAQLAAATTTPIGLPVSITYNGSTRAPVNAGTYAVVATVTSPNAGGVQNGTLTISPAPVTVLLSGLSAVFNGKAHKVTATVPGKRVAVNVTYDSSTIAPSAIGTYNVVATVNNVDYTGMAAGNLTISAPPPPAVKAVAAKPGATRTGIWAEDSSGTLQLIAQTGGAATGYLTLGDPAYNDHAATAFIATYRVGTTLTTGIFCNSAGPLELVVQTGDRAPGCPDGVTFSALTALALADRGGPTNQGGVVFRGSVAGPGVTRANDSGIWAVDSNGDLQLIVRTGDALDGKSVTNLAFPPGLTAANGPARRSNQEHADLAFLATFSDKSTAILSVVFP